MSSLFQIFLENAILLSPFFFCTMPKKGIIEVGPDELKSHTTKIHNFCKMFAYSRPTFGSIPMGSSRTCTWYGNDLSRSVWTRSQGQQAEDKTKNMLIFVLRMWY